MKLKTLLTKARKELKTEQEKKVLNLVKISFKNIVSCKKTLKRLEKEHQVLMNSKLDELELDGIEY